MGAMVRSDGSAWRLSPALAGRGRSHRPPRQRQLRPARRRLASRAGRSSPHRFAPPFCASSYSAERRDTGPTRKASASAGAWITGMPRPRGLPGVPRYRAQRLSFRGDAGPARRRHQPPLPRRLVASRSPAERLEARGGVYLRGAQVEGAVSIAESRLGGNLECDGATIRTLGGYALIAPEAWRCATCSRAAPSSGAASTSRARS